MMLIASPRRTAPGRAISAPALLAWAALALSPGAACIPGVDSNSQPPSITEPGIGPPVGPTPTFEAPRNADRPAVPLIGGTLHLLADDRTAVASDPDRDAIFVVDYRQQELLATVTLQPGDEPGRIAEDDQRQVHVALRRGGVVVTLNPTTWAVAARRPVCAAPRGLAFDRAQSLLHVACADGELVSLPADVTKPVARRVTLDSDLRDVVVEGDLLLVSRFRSAQVLTVNRAGMLVERMSLPVRHAVRKIVMRTPSGGSGGVSMTDMEASVAWRLLGVNGGPTLMVHQRATNGQVQTEPGGYGGDRCGSIIESAVSPVRGAKVPAPALMGVVLPIDLAVSPDRRWLAVLSTANLRQGESGFGQLQAMELAPILSGSGGDCNFPSPPATLVPSMPRVVAPQPGDVLTAPPTVVNQPQGEAVAVAIEAGGHVLVQTREPATLQVITSETLPPLVLSGKSVLDTGHGIFHANTGADLACASCHPEGGDDGRVWKFSPKPGAPAEPRRTQNLRGGIVATAPFHWVGDLSDINALMQEVFVSRMQGPRLGSGHIETLKKWIDGVPSLPVKAPADTAAVDRGRALFTEARVGCATCHAGSGDALTNNTSKNVGTGQVFQVPSLRGLRYRAPYMHDGCAATLTERFQAPCGGGDLHGVTSKLSAAEVSDLVAYMESL